MTLARTKLRDGVELVYDIRGRLKDAPPVVLIHSLGMDHAFWDAVTPALADETAVLVYDCRGHGRSDKPGGPYRVEGFAEDLAQLLDHVGWRSAIVAGASMGGCITLAFAAAHPERAAGLGLFDTTAWYNAPDKWEERAHTAETKGLDALLEFQTTRWFTDFVPREPQGRARRERRRIPAQQPRGLCGDLPHARRLQHDGSAAPPAHAGADRGRRRGLRDAGRDVARPFIAASPARP